jgi:hypothetical protein
MPFPIIHFRATASRTSCLRTASLPDASRIRVLPSRGGIETVIKNHSLPQLCGEYQPEGKAGQSDLLFHQRLAKLSASESILRCFLLTIVIPEKGQ